MQAIGRGDFASLEGALKAVEASREILRHETEEAEKARRGMLELTPQVLERHLEGLVEKLRSGVTERVQEAIRATVEKILVGRDGTVTLDIKPQGLLGARQPLHIQSAGGPAPTWGAWFGLGRSIGLERETSAVFSAG